MLCKYYHNIVSDYLQELLQQKKEWSIKTRVVRNDNDETISFNDPVNMKWDNWSIFIYLSPVADIYSKITADYSHPTSKALNG